MTFERTLHASPAQFRHIPQKFDDMSPHTGDYHGRCLNRIDYAANYPTRHSAGARHLDLVRCNQLCCGHTALWDRNESGEGNKSAHRVRRVYYLLATSGMTTRTGGDKCGYYHLLG